MDSLSKVYNYLGAQCQTAQEQEDPAQQNVWGFVTISRQAGAGGITIGEKLADYLNKKLPAQCPWTVFDKNLVHEVIKEHNLPAKILPFLKEARIPDVEDMLEDLLGLHPSQTALVHRTTETILHLAKMGRAILVGRGAPVITQEMAGGTHIRLIGSFIRRKDHIKEYYRLSDDEEVELFIETEDRGRAQYLKTYFNEDVDNPLLYDLIINTDKVSYDDAALLIGELVIKKINSARAISRTNP